MIKNLNIVVAEDKNGKVKVVHVGKDRSRAKEAFQKAAASKENFQCVIHCRNPQFEARKFPSKAARYRAELQAEADAAKQAAEGEELARLEAQARLNSSFAALELADIHGIRLAGIAGTGPNGQVIVADLTPLIPSSPPAAETGINPPAVASESSGAGENQNGKQAQTGSDDEESE
jgi:pyruvate/2-oxoglutarate dehydrogenase complex dihydrolipoamide acyltransferase (E2) component